jgi:hypothetical protein
MKDTIKEQTENELRLFDTHRGLCQPEKGEWMLTYSKDGATWQLQAIFTVSFFNIFIVACPILYWNFTCLYFQFA